MSNRKSSARSRRPPKRKPARYPAVPTGIAFTRIPELKQTRLLNQRARFESKIITAALEEVPALDRAAMGADLFPFNEIASAPAVAALIDTLVARRIPDNLWNAVHGPLCKTDRYGAGYEAWLDAFRDAAFMVGVDYALQSLPSWWSDLRSLPELTQESLRAIIAQTVAHAVEHHKRGPVMGYQKQGGTFSRAGSQDRNAIGTRNTRD